MTSPASPSRCWRRLLSHCFRWPTSLRSRKPELCSSAWNTEIVDLDPVANTSWAQPSGRLSQFDGSAGLIDANHTVLDPADAVVQKLVVMGATSQA